MNLLVALGHPQPGRFTMRWPANTSEIREREVFGDPLNCILAFCGVANVRRKMFATVAASTPGQREAWLREARNLVRDLFPGDKTSEP